MKRFFLTCPIGFEPILIQELEYKWDFAFPHSDCIIHEQAQGGIEIECELEHGLILNYLLKVPSKILLRVKQQKCRDLPKLYNIIKKINWKEYLQQENIKIKVSSKKSRLIHTKRIEQSAARAFIDYFKANKLPVKTKELNENNTQQNVFIRLNEDDLTISLDTSGELMHVRQDRDFRGHGSIRENIACALLIKLLGLKPIENITLIDPMCGTGTFLFEAQNFHKLTKRDFLFNQWNINLKQDISLITISPPWSFKQIIGYDIDSNIINMNKKIASSIRFEPRDIFDEKRESIDNEPQSSKQFIICNPPYGKRVKIEGNKEIFFKNIVSQSFYSRGRCQSGFIIPTPFENKLKGSKLYFSQNGISVCFLTH